MGLFNFNNVTASNLDFLKTFGHTTDHILQKINASYHNFLSDQQPFAKLPLDIS